MATDKLINQTQGADIIDALSDIATNVGNITYGPQTSADKVVSMTGYQKASAEAAISEGDTLNQAIGKLEKKADDNATDVAGKIDKLTNATAGDIATVTATGEIADSEVAIETTLSDSSDAKVPTSKAVGTYVDGKGYAVGVNSSTANNLVAFNDANGKALKDSGIAVAKSSTGLTDSDTAVPTSKTVKTYVDSTATGISRYLGTITAASGLSTSAKKGDFYVVKTAWTGVHAGDEIIAEKDNPAQTIDGTNWSLLHNEADTDTKYTFATGDSNGTFKVTPSDTGTAQSVPIKGLGNAAYKGVATSVSTSEDLVTSKAVNTKLASYVPNSDLIGIVNNGAKNMLSILNYGGLSDTGISVSDIDGTAFHITGSTSIGDPYYVLGYYVLPDNTTYNASMSTTGTGSCTIKVYGHRRDNNNWTQLLETYTSQTFTTDNTTYFEYMVRAQFKSGSSTTYNADAYPMICINAQFSISSAYEPYALGNQIITPAMIEQVDSGAKNLLPNKGQMSHGNVTFTWNNDGSVTISGTKTAGAECYVSVIDNVPYSNIGLKAGDTIVLSNNGTNAYISVIFWASGSGYTSSIIDVNETKPVVLPANKTNILIRLTVKSDVTSVSETIKPMCCTKAAFGVSSKFVPYRPNWDLVCNSIDDLYIRSFVKFPASARQSFELTIASYKDSGRGSFLISFTSQSVNSYVPSLYYVAVADGHFGVPVALVPNSEVVTAVTRTSDNTKLQFAVIGNTWAEPILIPLIDSSCNLKFSATWT